MHYQIYQWVKWLKSWCDENEFVERIPEKRLLERFHIQSLEDIYRFLPKECIDLTNEWLNSEKEDFLIEKMNKSFMGLSPEELSSELDEYLKDESSYADIGKAFPDVDILLAKLDLIGIPGSKELVISQIPIDKLIAYVNDEGKYSDEVLRRVSIKYANSIEENSSEEERLISGLNSDFHRAQYILRRGRRDFLPFISDLYFKSIILISTSKYSAGKKAGLASINRYNEYLKILLDKVDEHEKALYIASIEDDDVKEAMLLTYIEKKENKAIVLDSFTREVDKNIAGIDEFARNMITEFFEDELGDDFSDDKREKLDICLRRTSVYLVESTDSYSGRAYWGLRRIKLSNKLLEDKKNCIAALLHEYEHIFDSFYDLYTLCEQPHTTREGMADVFADLVLKHYIDKHRGEEILIDGERVSFGDDGYSLSSIYNDSNSWVRTMLYGLVSSGNDIKAVAEYTLGSKNVFASMVFGPEVAKTKMQNEYGEAIIITNQDELYHSPMLDFSDIDESSIYYRRNYILPRFQLQNKIGEKANVLDMSFYEDRKDAFGDLIKLYFDGQAPDEVTKAELDHFSRLLKDIVKDTAGLNGKRGRITVEDIGMVVRAIKERDESIKGDGPFLNT